MTLKAIVTHGIVTSFQKLSCYHINLIYAKLHKKNETAIIYAQIFMRLQ